MKQRFQFCSVLFLMIFLLSSEQMTARISPFKQGDEKEAAELYVPAATASNGISFQILENTDSVEVLMGLEGCENGDEECPTRRVLSEAHLDYIYTQQHKP